jgi:hypothetical protein
MHYSLEDPIRKKENIFYMKFLGAFTKLQKVTIGTSIYPSINSSVYTEHLGSHWTDFDKIWYLILFKKSGELKLY